MKHIDLEKWKRKEHFNFFYRADYPQYNICMDIDVTRFLAFIKKEGISFYYAMIFSVIKVVNSLDSLKYRIRDGKVVLHDIVHPSFTDMKKDKTDDLFKVVTLEMKDNILEFVNYAKETSENQQNYFELGMPAGRDDLVYITCLPWIKFTHISHTVSLNKNDSIPRISWGKYYKQGERILLPFSVQVHHALADGYHVAMFVEKLQEFIDNL
jgi:chloramphenicol O-acetyltransferase type A